MMYPIKKILSALTASVLAFAAVIPGSTVNEVVSAEEPESSAASMIPETGTDAIYDVVIDQSQAQITYVASADCFALLAFYDDDGSSLVTSFWTDLKRAENETTVTVSLSQAVPDHFLLKAFLLDKSTNAPLSREFVSSVYTAGIQAIRDAKASDFDPALTINLDDSDEENFIVLKKDTVQIPYDGVHNLFDSYDSDHGVYTFKNADANLTELPPGTNVFCYSPNMEDVVLFNVGSIRTGGSTVFVTAGDLDLASAVEVIDLHCKGSGTIDAEPGEELYPGMVYEGTVPKNQVRPLPGFDKAFEMEEAFRFTISTPFAPKLKGPNCEFSLDGSITLEISPIAERELLWSEDGQYLRTKESFETSISTDVTFSGKLEVPIPYVSGNLPLPGIFEGKAGLFFMVEAEGSLKVAALYDLNVTTTSDNDTPVVGLKRKNVTLTANTTAFIGFALKISVEVGDPDKNPDEKPDENFHWDSKRNPFENLLSVDIGVKAGLQLDGRYEYQDMATEKHACLQCLSLSVKLVAYGYDKEHLAFLFSHERKVTLYDKTLKSMYYSLTYHDGGDGECPHKMKTVSFDFHDETGSYGHTGYWGEWPVNVDEFIIRRDGIVVDTFWACPFDYQQTASELAEHDYTYEFRKEVIAPVTGVIDGSESKLDLLVKTYYNYHPVEPTIVTPPGFDIPGHPNYQKWYHTYPGIGEFTIYSDGHAQLNKLYPETGYVIPEQVDGHPVYWLEVTEDLSGHYEEFIGIPEVFMPQTWVEGQGWGEYDFIRGTGAVTVMEPTSFIPSRFFALDCFSQINLPQTIETIGAWAFTNCPNLTSITIPDNCNYIGKYAFGGDHNLTDIHLPAELQSISPELFGECDKLESVTIPDKTERISEDAFRNCTALKSIEIPKSVECIGKYAFNNCTSLTSVTIPSNVHSVNEHAFQACTALKEVVLEEGVTHLGTGAFAYTAVETLQLPESLEIVDETPIFGMYSLKSLTIPKHNPFQGTNIICDAPELTDIYYPGTLKDWYENGYHFADWGAYYDQITLHFASYQTALENVLTDKHNLPSFGASEGTTTPAPGSSGITAKPTKTLTSGSSVQTQEMTSISFNKLQPGARVLLAAVRSEDVTTLQPDDLLYIDQTTASSDGVARFTFRTLPKDAVFLIFQQTSETSYTSYSSTLPLAFEPASGDADLDGQLTVTDVIMVQKWILKADRLSCWENCDLNRDGSVDVFDLALMKRMLLKK